MDGNSNQKYMEKSSVYPLAGSVEYSGEAIVSKTVLKKECGNITLFAFDKGQGLSQHSAPFDAFVLVTDGRGRITIGGKDYELRSGECIIMPANVPHAVYATDNFKMMLVMIKSD